MKIKMARQIFVKFSRIKFLQNRVVPMRTDRRMEERSDFNRRSERWRTCLKVLFLGICIEYSDLVLTSHTCIREVVYPFQISVGTGLSWLRFSWVGFEVLTAVSMKIAVFWVVAPCSLVEVYQRFRGPCCLSSGRSPRIYGATTQNTAIFEVFLISHHSVSISVGRRRRRRRRMEPSSFQ
jgi:hypothetical protein